MAKNLASGFMEKIRALLFGVKSSKKTNLINGDREKRML